MPPAALISSAAIFMPFVDEMPKLAVLPVKDIKTPILTLLALLDGWHANVISKLAMTVKLGRMRFILVLIS